MIRTAIRHGAHFSVTVPVNDGVRAAIAAIPAENWMPIRYPQAVWDDRLECRVSDAEAAGTSYAAFTSKPKKQQVTARLIVRRVRVRLREPLVETGAIPNSIGGSRPSWSHIGDYRNPACGSPRWHCGPASYTWR